MIKFLDLQKQYHSIQEEIDKTIYDVISSSSFVGGEKLQRFEKNFAAYHNAQYCIGVGNGTDALEIALWALDLPKGSEVILPANTFIATSEAVTRNGLNIVFADCDEDYTISTKSIQENITDQTSCIIAVHLYGQPCKMQDILDIAKKYDLKVLEDAAQAHGALYKERKIGTFGDAATFSFYPGKNLGAYGDGGAIITNSMNLAQRCKIYSNHGRSSKYAHEIEGINSRLDTLQASILDVKLKHLDKWIIRRNEIARFYLQHIKNKHINLPTIRDDITHVFHLFVIRTKNRDALQAYLSEHKIQTGIHYPTALPSLKAYENHTQNCANYFACKTDKELLSLPIGEHLTQSQIQQIVQVVNNFDL